MANDADVRGLNGHRGRDLRVRVVSPVALAKDLAGAAGELRETILEARLVEELRLFWQRDVGEVAEALDRGAAPIADLCALTSEVATDAEGERRCPRRIFEPTFLDRFDEREESVLGEVVDGSALAKATLGKSSDRGREPFAKHPVGVGVPRSSTKHEHLNVDMALGYGLGRFHHPIF